MNEIGKKLWWLTEYISKPIQLLIYAILFFGLIFSLPSIIESCNRKPNYETMKANFMGEEAELHGENFFVKVLDATTVDKIAIKDNYDLEELVEKEGHYIAVTLSIKQGVNSEKSHTLDGNDFKLKDHTGTIVPLSDIMSLIDVDSFDLRADEGDSINGAVSFSTKKAIKDCSWQGLEISSKKETVITVYFEMNSNLDVEETIMILEVDFYTGFGKTNSATDIVLFERKEPVK